MALARQSAQPDPGRSGAKIGAGGAPPDVVARQNAALRGATERYQRAQIESASPTRLVVLLYEGGIRFCRLAQEAMRNGDLETQNTNLIRAQKIVGELLASLNRTKGGELASSLSSIYAHILEELVQANLYDKPEKLDHVISLLSEMRGSWVEIDRLASGEGPLVDAPDPVGQTAQVNRAENGAAPRRTAVVPTPVHPPQPISRLARAIAAQNGAAGQTVPSRLGDQRA